MRVVVNKCAQPAVVTNHNFMCAPGFYHKQQVHASIIGNLSLALFTVCLFLLAELSRAQKMDG